MYVFERLHGRLQVTTTDQETGTLSTDKEPLRTLAKIRSGSVLGWEGAQPSWKNAVFFGEPSTAACGFLAHYFKL